MTVNGDRGPIIVSTAVGITVLAAAGMHDRLLLGVFIGAGIGLGLTNAWLTRLGVAALVSESTSGKGPLAAITGVRLFAVTALALVAGVLTRPDGLGILYGLVTFQIGAALWAAAPALRRAR
ncbi:hypothetical protein [Nocardia bhagyanarayanae]|uniref:Uncharacterized protein n=1 Tax=Nocardia bhagyanarayanae TaxID=1215925 RepID=A0A543FGE1_9NOCA|nr:hypothetical protein [Nocardia bhagyanarayanae]TQM32814.1 hypothetical protein FB390_4514 [Nocardia bhagyanarayanae]